MVNNRSNVVMITEEDIKQLLLEWDRVPFWIKIHVSTRCPAHRYEGQLWLGDENLVFRGRDMKEGKSFELEIPLNTITDVNLGFSEEVRACIDPAFGVGGPVPVVVCYQDNSRSETMYFNTCVDNYLPHMNVNNMRWCKVLQEMVTKRKCQDSKVPNHLVLSGVRK